MQAIRLAAAHIRTPSVQSEWRIGSGKESLKERKEEESGGGGGGQERRSGRDTRRTTKTETSLKREKVSRDSEERRGAIRLSEETRKGGEDMMIGRDEGRRGSEMPRENVRDQGGRGGRG